MLQVLRRQQQRGRLPEARGNKFARFHNLKHIAAQNAEGARLEVRRDLRSNTWFTRLSLVCCLIRAWQCGGSSSEVEARENQIAQVYKLQHIAAPRTGGRQFHWGCARQFGRVPCAEGGHHHRSWCCCRRTRVRFGC